MPVQQPSGDDEPSIYLPYGASGGGGANGQYVFANVDEMDRIISKLDAIAIEIRDEDDVFQRAIALASPPAHDVMSVGQVEAYRAALKNGRDHNQAVLAYTEDQLAKLKAARQTYIVTDSGAAERLRNIDGANA